jgi:deoxyribodipyrimidine photolyase-like uncharacterized protein
MPEAAAGDEDGEEPWAFDDLNDEEDDEEFCTPSPSSTSSDEHLISVQEYIR